MKSVHAPQNNLPVQLTSFVGRDQQIADLKRLLSLQGVMFARTRLLTFTGAGGSGKTRLAIQVANDLVDAFQDGVWFVDLSPLFDPALIPQAVASALSVHEQPGRALLDTLLDYLQGKELLLIIDNCEQFVSACAELVQTLLQKCPHLQILVTSRERLNLAGETVWLVPTLSLPDAEHPDWIEDSRSEAVRLFVESAASTLPTFALTMQNAPAVSQICRRLDGIPLAIELAAARIKVLTPTQIGERLDNAFRLLTRGSHAAPPRQQTLRAAMNWSYELLSAHEQMLFRRLSVFAGGFTLESVEQVCAGERRDDLAGEDILDLLSDLVDKSLVVVAAWEEGEQVRYRLLEPIRRYASEKLSDAEEDKRTRDNHSEFFLGFAKEIFAYPLGEKITVYQRGELEHDNLSAGLNWALKAGAVEDALEFCDALADFWGLRGFATEGRIWFEQALAASRRVQASSSVSHHQRELFAKVLVWSANQALAQGDYSVGRAHGEEGLRIFTELGDKAGVYDALFNLGGVAWSQGDSETAQTLWEQHLRIACEMGDKQRIAGAEWILGVLAKEQGDYSNARFLSENALARFRELEDSNGIGWVLENLACVAMLEGDLEKSKELFAESLIFCKKSGDELELASWLYNRGFLAWCAGDLPDAQSNFKRALAAFHRMQTTSLHIARCLAGVAVVDATYGRAYQATRLLGAIRMELERTGTPITDIYLDAYDRALATARSQLTQGEFDAAWAEGQALTIRQAITYALGNE